MLMVNLSVYTNACKLLSTRRNAASLDALHGLRFFSMTWVLLGHTYFFLGISGVAGKPKHALRWRQNGRDSVSNHQPRHCLLSLLFGRRSKKTSKLRVTGLCVGNSPGPVNSPHKGPVTRKMFPFDDVIMDRLHLETLPETQLYLCS